MTVNRLLHAYARPYNERQNNRKHGALCWQQIHINYAAILLTATIGHRTLRAPADQASCLVTGKARQYINSVPVQAGRHSFPPEATDISVGRDLDSSWRRRRADARDRQGRHDDEARLGGVTFDGRLPSIRHFRAGRNPDGRTNG